MSVIQDILGLGDVEELHARADAYLAEQGLTESTRTSAQNADYSSSTGDDTSSDPDEAAEESNLDNTEIEIRLSPDNAYTFTVTLPPDPRDVRARHQDTKPIVRRPTIGLIGYEDQYASIEVIARTGDSSAGAPQRLINTSYRDGVAEVTTNFIIQQVNETDEEAIQIVETFNDFYLADVGEKPSIIQVTGALFAAKNFPWLQEWRHNYNNYLRGRQCILRGAQVYLTVADEMYVGYIIRSNVSRSVTSSFYLVPFGFTMVLRQTIDIRSTPLPNIDRTGPTPGSLREFAENRRAGARQSTYIGGIRIPDTVSFVPGPGEIQEFSPAQKESIEDTPDDGADDQPIDLAFAQAFEIVQGELAGQVHYDVPELQFKESIDKSVTQFNLDRLVALASSLNSQAGTELFNLQNLRVQYAARFEEDLRALGLLDEYGPSTFGLPSDFQSEADARRRRQQEEVLRNGREAFDNLRGRIGWG